MCNGLVHFVPAHVRHLELYPASRSSPGRGTASPCRAAAKARGVPPHCAEQHLQAEQIPRRLFARRVQDRAAQPRASTSRMQSRIAPWPGIQPARHAARSRIGGDDHVAVRCNGSIALATERRLPIRNPRLRCHHAVTSFLRRRHTVVRGSIHCILKARPNALNAVSAW